MTRNRRSAGLSLAEIVVALGLSVVLLLALFSVESTATLVRNGTRESDLAREAARGQLEQVLATPFASIPFVYAAPFAFDVPGLTPVNGAASPGRITLDTTTAPASPTLVKVIVEVRWRGRRGDQRLELSTLRGARG